MYRRIGAHIRRSRLDAGMSQMRLAGLAKVHHNYISRIELGKAEVSVAVLLRICKALKVNPAELWAET